MTRSERQRAERVEWEALDMRAQMCGWALFRSILSCYRPGDVFFRSRVAWVVVAQKRPNPTGGKADYWVRPQSWGSDVCPP